MCGLRIFEGSFRNLRIRVRVRGGGVCVKDGGMVRAGRKHRTRATGIEGKRPRKKKGGGRNRSETRGMEAPTETKKGGREG